MTGQSTGKTILNLPSLPAPSERRLALRVRPAAERALRGGHPWLYAEAIQQQSHEGQPGDLGVVFDRQRRFVAIGLYDPLSPLRLRVLQQGRRLIDRDWFAARLAAALALRSRWRRTRRTTGYRRPRRKRRPARPVVDRYDQTVVLKLYTAAWVPHLPALLDALLDRLPAAPRAAPEPRRRRASPPSSMGCSPAVLAGPPLNEPRHLSGERPALQRRRRRRAEDGLLRPPGQPPPGGTAGGGHTGAQRLCLYGRVFALRRARRRATGHQHGPQRAGAGRGGRAVCAQRRRPQRRCRRARGIGRRRLPDAADACRPRPPLRHGHRRSADLRPAAGGASARSLGLQAPGSRALACSGRAARW